MTEDNQSQSQAYEDTRLNAVLRRVLLEHNEWLKDQPQEVHDFFEGETLGDDVDNAMAMIQYATTDAPESLQYGFAVGGIYGMLIAVLRVTEMLDGTTVSDVVQTGREVHATVGSRFHAPLQVCGKTVDMLKSMLEEYGHTVGGTMVTHDDFSRKGTFTVADADGTELLSVTHGEYVQVSLDGDITKSEKPSSSS